MEFKVGERGIGSTFGKEELDAVAQALKGNTLTYGPMRDKFEREFAEYVGVKYALAVSSCTAALDIATQIVAPNDGDEIICSSQTFKATVIGALARRLSIRFADVNPETLNVDPESIRSLITPRTKAIFIVHYGGLPCDMDPIVEIMREHNLLLVEDVAHAPGAEYKGRKTGSFGDIGCFSFHSLKNMTTLGEGGMITTNNDKFAEAAKNMRSMGILGNMRPKAAEAIGPYQRPSYLRSDHSDGAYTTEFEAIYQVGTNYRMNEAQAAVGSVQLRKLDSFNDMRRANSAYLNRELSKIKGISFQPEPRGFKHVYHLYTMFIDPELGISHDRLVQFLEQEKGIQIIMRYMPVHLLPAHQYYGHGFGECPVAERIFFESQINFPMHPAMPREELYHIIESVKEAVRTLRAPHTCLRKETK